MSEVKLFVVSGEIRKPNLETSFRKEVVATKLNHAVEKVYAELGSRHRVKRFQIRISKVEEIQPKDIEDPMLRKFIIGE